MAESNKKPAIRFAGFTDSWEQREFGELAEYKKGPFGSALKKEIFVPKGDDTVKVYEQQNAIKKNSKLERYFITKSYAEKLKGFKVQAGDMIVSCAGTIGEIYVLPSDSEVGIINQALMRVRINEQFVDKILFKYLFSNMIDEFSMTHSNGSAIKNIPPFADLKPMKVRVPSIDEQRQIVNLFTNIDNLITLHQRKYDKLKNVKKSCLEKMFPKDSKSVPEIRFAGFTEPWEQRKLETVYGKIRNAFVGTATPHYVREGNFYLESNNVKDGQINRNSEIFINDEFYLKQKDNWLHTGDMVMVQSGHVGHAAVIPEELNNTAAHALIIFSNPKTEVNPYFLNYQYQTMSCKIAIGNITTGNTVKHILSSEMKEFTVSWPNIEEQNKIGNFFVEIDNLITLHQRELNKLQNIKKSCLEKMFV